MSHALVRRLWRGVPFAASCAVHLLVLAGVLAAAARLAPRLETAIRADLVAPEPTPPPPDASVKPVPKRLVPPLPKPTALPRPIESVAPTAEPPARAPEPPQVTSELLASKPDPVMEKPRPEARLEPPPEPRQPPPAHPPGPPDAGVSTGEPGRGGAPGAPADATSPDGLASGLSLLTSTQREPGGGGASPTGGGRNSGAPAPPGASAGGITRTAIPKGGYQVQPRYPATARRQGIQGSTMLRVFVASDGRVTDVAVERTAGHADLDEAAAEAVRRWRFEPARRGEEPVAMWVLLPVEFRLR